MDIYIYTENETKQDAKAFHRNIKALCLTLPQFTFFLQKKQREFPLTER